MENNARKANFNSKLLCGVAALLVLAIALVVFLWPSNVARELTVEAGRTGIEADLFLKKDKGDHAQFVTDVSAIDLSAIGEYPVTISYGGKNYDCTLIVKDTIAPEAQVRNLAIYSHETPEPEEFIVSIKDATAVTVQYEKRTDLSKDGSHLLKLILTDEGGNTADQLAVEIGFACIVFHTNNLQTQETTTVIPYRGAGNGVVVGMWEREKIPGNPHLFP